MAQTETSNETSDGTATPSVLPSSVATRVEIARAALWWERAWPALWPAVGMVGTYATLALVGTFETWTLLPTWAALLTTFGAAGFLLHRDLGWSEFPTRADGLRRLEEMNNLPHRPLSTYEDQAAAGTGSDQLWAAHRQWLKTRLASLRASWPSPGLAAHDPFALRSALVVCLVAAFAIAGPLAGSRLAQGFFPGFTGTGSTGQVDAWITPPDYTGRAPIFLTQTTTAALEVPEGSEITANIFGGSRPQVTLGAETLALKETNQRGEQAYETSATVEADTTLAITQGGRDQGTWPITVIPDEAPFVRLVEASATTRRTLKLIYEVIDDYGVVDLKMDLDLDPIFVLEDKQIFQLGDEPLTRDGFSPLIDGFVAEKVATQIDLPLPGIRPKDATNTAYKDLLSHPWAGLPVMLTLVVSDDAEQTSTSRTINMALPARQFTKPLAAALVEQRQRLAMSPLNRGSVAGFINAFALEGEKHINDASVYLGLRAAYWRLVKARRPGDLAGVSKLLWDLALHIEDGDLSMAERDLRAAREALAQALAEGASPNEIEQLMQELKSALSRYLDELAGNATAEMDPQLQPPGDGQMMERSDLEKMLDAIGDLAKTGARDQAQDLLSQLDDILENLNTEEQQQPTQGESDLADAIGEMGDIISEQRSLMDETFQHGQGAPGGSEGGESGNQGQNGAPPLENLQGQQDGIRQRLEDLMGQLGENGQPVPGELEQAARSMQRAQDRLSQGRPDSAAGAQGRAIDQLRSGAQALADAMFDSMGSGGEQSGVNAGGDQTDPLGRPLTSNGTSNSDSVKLPDELDLQRARQILEELRKRAAELGRPEQELEYLERLLRRF
ncbi:MAG: TIGR02302 family protein [Parvibaculaceae bacterium]|nr:TIGR02302 family protein [Parvibaculaceae bacterium]